MLAETPRGLGALVLVARDGGFAARDTKALAPASDIGGIGRTMRAPATGRMIMPGPARRHIDFEGDLAAQALALCNPRCCRCFCHLRLPCLSSLRAQPRSPDEPTGRVFARPVGSSGLRFFKPAPFRHSRANRYSRSPR